MLALIGALARTRLALDIVHERLALTGVRTTETRFKLIRVDSVRRGGLDAAQSQPAEVRVRVVGRTETMQEVVRVGNEVKTLHPNGPAGGGGAWKSARQFVAVVSTLIPQEQARPAVS